MPEEAAQQAPRFIERGGSALAAGLTAAVVLGCVIAAIFLIPDLTDSQRALFRFLIAIGAGAFATFFLGGVAMEGTVGSFRIAAGGGFASFLIMLLVVDPLPPPAGSKQTEADEKPAPSTGAASPAEPSAQPLQADTESDDDFWPTISDDFRAKLTTAASFASTNEGGRVVPEQDEAEKLQGMLLVNNLRSDVAITVFYDAMVQMGIPMTERLARSTTEQAGLVRSPSSEKRWLGEFVEQRRRFLRSRFPNSAAIDTRMDKNNGLVATLP